MLSCEFEAEPFNLFDCPVVWIKRQHLEEDEETQINLMGNLLDPFAATKRYRVTFAPQSARHFCLTLHIAGLYG